MKTSIKFRKFLNQYGIVLDNLHLSDVALRRGDALKALELLREDFIVVLGGDVFFREGSSISIAYANWNCRRIPSESEKDFAIRSCKVAAEYIRKFPEYKEKEVVFVLVPKEY